MKSSGIPSKILNDLYSKRGIKPGLVRIKALLREFQIKRFPFHVIHIAGTNGKGSTAMMAAKILEACGKKVGLYLSPHLLSVNERISVQGKQISDADFVKYIKMIYRKLESSKNPLLQEATFFEILTLASILYFRDRRVEWAVYEAGMGGRLDATNVFPSRICVITDISKEHTEFLGHTIKKIAGEKFAILKKGAKTVTSVSPALLEKVPGKKVFGSKRFFQLKRNFQVDVLEKDIFHQNIFYRDDPGGLFFQARVPSPVRVQAKNASLSIKACFEAVGKDMARDSFIAACRRALSCLQLPGRFQILRKNPYFIIDVAHNASGVSALVKTILSLDIRGDWCIIFGVLKDKKYQMMFAHLRKLSNDFIFVRALSERALGPNEMLRKLKKRWKRLKVNVIEDIQQALEFCKRRKSAKNILVCGSFFVAGPVLGCLARTKRRIVL
ncbi:MAG: hypothetical protein JW928_03460 [Candidatus Aureabacteria bacterium]|nr:hypothetical protein [Candidatus Auribacterota bacterium]